MMLSKARRIKADIGIRLLREISRSFRTRSGSQ